MTSEDIKHRFSTTNSPDGIVVAVVRFLGVPSSVLRLSYVVAGTIKIQDLTKYDVINDKSHAKRTEPETGWADLPADFKM